MTIFKSLIDSNLILVGMVIPVLGCGNSPSPTSVAQDTTQTTATVILPHGNSTPQMNTTSNSGPVSQSKIASSRYELEKNNNIAILKRDGEKIKEVDYLKFPNSEYIETIRQHIINIKSSESRHDAAEQLPAEARQDARDIALFGIALLEEQIESLIKLLKS